MPAVKDDPRNLRGSAVLLIVLTSIALGAWFLLDRDAGSTASSPLTTSADGKVIQQFRPEEREQVEPFSAELLDGSPFRTEDLAGTVAVFNVWGSWCGPCREEAPALARVARETNGSVRFVGINVRDNPDAARAFEDAYDVPYGSVRPGDSATALLAFGGTLASAAVPSTVVVDPDGRIAARVVGTVTYSTLRALVDDVVSEGSLDPE